MTAYPRKILFKHQSRSEILMKFLIVLAILLSYVAGANAATRHEDGSITITAEEAQKIDLEIERMAGTIVFQGKVIQRQKRLINEKGKCK